MRRVRFTMILVAALLVASVGPRSYGQEYYYDGDSAYQVISSETKIVVQMDSAYQQKSSQTLFEQHTCLDESFTPIDLERGFTIYGLEAGYGYAAAAESLLSDPAIHRALPVYVTVEDSAELPVMDLVNVRFEAELSMDSALALLDVYGMRFVDSSGFRHNLWRCALDDTIKESPLDYGNELNVAPGVLWACATFFISPISAGPTDPYYGYQYYLKNTGQFGGTPGLDIGAEQAFEITLTRPETRVAVIDVGIAPHHEFGSRLLPGYDFCGAKASAPQPDSIAAPEGNNAHGEACAGIIAAARNDTGVVGVCGTCEILPIKVGDNNGAFVADPAYLAEAIYYAQAQGAHVVSNSWYFQRTTAVVPVARAIRDVVDCAVQPNAYTAQSKLPEGAMGVVMVFAAGNTANKDWWKPRAVCFPANMPEVIAVGAINDTGARQPYSCYGGALDVVAPSGRDTMNVVCEPPTSSDIWTTDLMADTGWNPSLYHCGDANGDYDYTSHMGGTSGACPQVAGIAALLMARGSMGTAYCNPGPQILAIIESTATDVGAAGRDDSTGYGLPNAYQALLSIIHGDINNSGAIDTADAHAFDRYCFRGGPPPALEVQVADCDCDGDIDIFDYLRIADAAGTGPLIAPCFFHY